MSSHSHRCIIHPQHDQVGVCGLCLRERLVALAESESSNVLSCSSTASDGAFHSFSSSSAPEHHYQLSPPPSDHQHSIKGQPPATKSSSTSYFHKLKLKALISIPPSPERVISKNSAGLLYSPSRKSKPTRERKPSTSEVGAIDAPNDRYFAPSTLPLGAHRDSKASLRSLFHQTEFTAAVEKTEYPYSGFVERTCEAPLDDRRRRIEQFSAAMRSPGFSPLGSASHESKQGNEIGTDDGSRSHTSWIASLFQRKKQKGNTKPRKNAMDSKAGNGAFETSARTSVDLARVSMDSASTALNLKQMIRSRLQQEEGDAMKNVAGGHVKHSRGRPPLGNEHHKVHINSKMEHPQPTSNNMYTSGYEFPARSSISIGSTISVAGTRISSTARLGVEGDKPSDDHDANASEEAPHFPRSRSCGRAWSRGQSPYSSIASPQHVLWGSSKQVHHNTTSVKLSSVQHHYLTSTPKHPAMDNATSKDSRVGFGFYFSPFRRSKRPSDQHDRH